MQLPDLYKDETIPADVSNYARFLAERQGLDGLCREAARLLHKIRKALSVCGEGPLKGVLRLEDKIGQRIALLEARRDIGGICRELDHLQGRIVRAQRMAAPWSKCSLLLHTSPEHWERWPHYAAKLDFFRETAPGHG